MGSYVCQERGCKDVWNVQWRIILSSLLKMTSWPQSMCRNIALDLVSLKFGKSALPVERVMAPLFILFNNVLILLRTTVSKAAILHFHIYIYYSNRFFGFLCTFIVKSLAKYSNPGAISQNLHLHLQNNSWLFLFPQFCWNLIRWLQFLSLKNESIYYV